MEERWEVLEGRAQFTIGEEGHVAGPGDVVVAPPARGTWPGTRPTSRSRLRSMRPALRWREFTTRFFAGDDPIELLDEFAARGLPLMSARGRKALDDLRAFALGLPGAFEDDPWGHEPVVKVGKKIFVFLGSEDAPPSR